MKSVGRFFLTVILGVGLAAVGSSQAAITLDWVLVNNAGNAADTKVMNDGTSGYGAVAEPFAISKYEVTAAQYTAFLNAVAATDTYGLYNTVMWTSPEGAKIERLGSPGSYTYQVAADYANRPVNYVSWADAARFANWLHNGQPTGLQVAGTTETGAYALNGANTLAALATVVRGVSADYYLPSENEWYKAAYYDPNSAGYFLYPTASNTIPSNLVQPVDPGNNANFTSGAQSIGAPYYRTPVGEFENSDSPFGTFDQGGNVAEWTESLRGSTNRVYRGGSYDFNFNNLRATVRNSQSPLNETKNLGFRIAANPAAAIPEPASASLALLAAAGLLRRRR